MIGPTSEGIVTGEDFWGKAMFVGFIGAAVVLVSNGSEWALGICLLPMVVYALRYW